MASFGYAPASAPQYACTTTWAAGDTAWQCKDCQQTEYSAICESCFLSGGHQSHNHAVYQSIGGGRCDCGDPSAWKSSGFCKVHTEPATAAASPSWGSPVKSRQEESAEESDVTPPRRSKGSHKHHDRHDDEDDDDDDDDDDDGGDDALDDSGPANGHDDGGGGAANSELSDEDVPEDDGESEEDGGGGSPPAAVAKPVVRASKPQQKEKEKQQRQRKKSIQSQQSQYREDEEDLTFGLPEVDPEDEDEFQIIPVEQLKNAVAQARHASRKGDNEKAVEHFTQALAYAYLCDMRLSSSTVGGVDEEPPSSAGDASIPIIRLHLAMAKEYSAQDLCEQALFHTAKALQRCRSHHKVPSVLMTTPATMLAHAEARLLVKKQVGAISKALKLLEEAYTLNLRLRGDKDLLNLDILMVRASTHVLAGDRKKAKTTGDGSGERSSGEGVKGANRHYGKAVEDYYLAWEILDGNQASNSDAMAELYCRIAEALQKQAEDEQAAEMYKKGIAVYESLDLSSSPSSSDAKLNLASAYYKLSLLYYRMESYPDALLAIADSVKVHEEALGESHVDTLHVLKHQGLMLFKGGDLEGADKVYRVMVQRHEETSGRDSAQVAEALKYLANVNVARENMDEACELYERALAIVRKVHGSKSRRARDLETRLGDMRRMWQGLRR